MSPRRELLTLGAALLLVLTPSAADAHRPRPAPEPTLLVAALGSGLGSAVGPDGALYVTEPAAGEISRVDRRTGEVTTFASGLPIGAGALGGVFDVAFLHGTAYALTTLVNPEVGGVAVDGIYRVDGPTTFTLVADIGAFALDNPPETDFFVPTGVAYAFEPYRDGFLVTDGHHNRVYRVGLDGTVSTRMAFGNVVPAGLAVHGRTVFVAQAGPVPHLPEDGRVVAFGPRSTDAWVLASGGPLMVDVETGRGHDLYALAQGDWPAGGAEGSPAAPGTGRLYEVGRHGRLRQVAEGLDRPTSFEVVHGAAYVVTLDGEVWTVDLRR